MTLPPLQPTRLQSTLARLGDGLLGWLRRGWRRASSALLALLGGFWLAQNLTTLLMLHLPGGRPMAALGMLLVAELTVRLRSHRGPGQEDSAVWLIIDNLRAGALYAVVLEAFKLGT